MTTVEERQTLISAVMERQYERNITMVLFLGDVATCWYKKLLHLYRTFSIATVSSSDQDGASNIVAYCIQVLRTVLMEERIYEDNRFKSVSSGASYRNVQLPPPQHLSRMVHFLHTNYFGYLDKCRQHVRIVRFIEEFRPEREAMLPINNKSFNAKRENNFRIDAIDANFIMKVILSTQYAQVDMKSPHELPLPAFIQRRFSKPDEDSSLKY